MKGGGRRRGRRRPTCPQCKGSKRLKLEETAPPDFRVEEADFAGGHQRAFKVTLLPREEEPEVLSVTEVDCPTCGGRGTVTEEEARAYEEALAAWCGCERVEDKDLDYFEAGQHPELEKEHWRHIVCGKIYQVG